MNKTSGIYYIENKINNKKYIGQSAWLNKRKWEHFRTLKNGNHINPHLQNSYNKYGKDAFEFKVILYAEPDELTKYEQAFVDRHNPQELYNIHLECVSSGLGVKVSEETRRNMGMAHKGKRHSAETCAKMSASHFGHEVSNITRKKLSIANRGRKHTKEECRKMSEAQKGRIPWNKGKTNIYSDETRELMGRANIGRVVSEETKRRTREVNAGNKYALGYKHTPGDRARMSAIAKELWRKRKRR